MAVYTTKGCQYAATKQRCTICNFSRHAHRNVSEGDIARQHDVVLHLLAENGYQQVDVLTAGNFYNDAEVSPASRDLILRSLSGVNGLARVLTESRREYITEEKLIGARRLLRDDQRLVYALGYESSDPHVRNDIIGKNIPESHLDEALRICKAAGVDFAAYVLIKPHVLSESQAIVDAVTTALHVFDKAARRGIETHIAFEPAFVVEGTVLDERFKANAYTTPWLWSVADVLIRTAHALGMSNAAGKLFVGLSDENLSDGRTAGNCGACDEHVLGALQAFNGHQDISQLEALDHDCKDRWRKLTHLG